MKYFYKRILGVSLVEVLLVLFISSLIAIAAFQYQKTQSQNAVAAEFAEQMYEYSQSVRKFVDENETALAAGMAPPFTQAEAPGSTFTQTGTQYIVTGVDWLTVVKSPVTGQTYLPKGFSFDNMQPLQLQRTPSSNTGTGSTAGASVTAGTGTPSPSSGAGTALIGDQAVETTIEGSPTASMQIAIQYGELYDVSDATKPPQPKAAITAKAANIASNLNDPLMGPSSFTYLGGSLDASGNVSPIIATIKHSTLGGEVYLRLDGATSMLNNISFDVTNATSRAITGVANIAFDPSGNSSSITDISTITMGSSGGTINNVNAIAFINGGGMSNLSQLQFASGGTISGLSSITFGSGVAFSGVRNIFTFHAKYDDHNSHNDYPILTSAGEMARPGKYMCSLSRVDDQKKSAGSVDTICSMYIRTDSNGLYYVLNVGLNMVCETACFQYAD